MLRRIPALAALRDAHDVATLLRFATVGLVTTGLDLGVFTSAGAVGVPPVPANVLSYSCGIAVSYLLNRRWTFATGGSVSQAAKFVIATGSGLVLSTILLAILTKAMPPLAAKLTTVPIVFFWNYHSTRLWVFRRKVPREAGAGGDCR